MMQLLTGITVLFTVSHIGFSQNLSTPGVIRCRSCRRVTALEQCTSLEACDALTESCYMDQYISTDAKVYYTGGCRNKAVCQSASNIVFGKKKKRDDGDLKSCSRCCHNKDDCNRRLCGIPSLSQTAQCYNCDAKTPSGDQGLVSDPSECNTLDSCQNGEICLAYTRKTVLGNKYGFRCEKLQVCDILMKRVILDYSSCYDDPDPNLCGIFDRKRNADTCFVCCGEGGCNSRTCEEIKEYIWTLKQNGALNETSWRAF